MRQNDKTFIQVEMSHRQGHRNLRQVIEWPTYTQVEIPSIHTEASDFLACLPNFDVVWKERGIFYTRV